MTELALIDHIRKVAEKTGNIQMGIGDDCAIFRPRAGEDLLFTTDQLIEGVHFRKSAPAAAVGERSLARSLSDIAAMGGRPHFCLVALAVPKRKPDRWIVDFYRGLTKLARRTGTTLAGGDLSHDDKIHCDVMVCGGVARGKALRRDGARPGNELYVSGRLGKSWDEPIRPRLAFGQSLVGRATACIDLSDGLSLDLHRLCQASGVAAELERVPVGSGSTIERALHGGEDYELLFTLPSGVAAPRGSFRVGRIVRGTPGKIRLEGRVVAPQGYDHFAGS